MNKREPVSSVGTSFSVSSEVKGRCLLAQAEERWRRGGPLCVAEAVSLCDAALAVLMEQSGETRAGVWLRRGQILESGRSVGQLSEAARSHEAGLAALGVARVEETGAADEAGRGGVGGGGGRAGRLRSLLWMNRGNALLALGSHESAREAVRSYDEALAIAAGSGGVAVEVGGRDEAGGDGSGGGAERRALIGAAWLNRAAAARLAFPGAAGLAEEGRCLTRAMPELAVAAEGGLAAARRNLAGAWLNRSAWCGSTGDAVGAHDALREAIRAVGPEARRDAVALEAGLRARHALCVAQGNRLAAGETLAPAEEAELFAQIDAGLADYAAWGGGGAGSREAARLFEFGAWWFRTRAPQSLGGFLRRNVDGRDAERLETAGVAVELASQEILRTGFAELLDERGREPRARLLELGVLADQLAGWRKAHRQGARRA